MITLDLTFGVGRFELAVNCACEEGWLVIFGPSGSGKTTLLECVAGLRRPQRGRIRIGDRTLFDDTRQINLPPRMRRVGYVSQTGDLFPHLDVQANLVFGATRERFDTDFTRITEMLELGDLLKRHPHQLSGGQRQRVALGRALLSTCDLLVLDEPLAALDVSLRRRLLDDLVKVRHGFSTPCLYVTHNLGEVVALADRVLVLDEGRQIGLGGPALAMATLQRHEPLEELADGLENLLELPFAGSDEEEGITYLALGGNDLLAVPFLAHRHPHDTLRARIPADDVILARGLTGQISARNLLSGRVVDIVARPHAYYVQTTIGAGHTVWSHVTPAALRRLKLEPGCDVTVVIKTHAVRAL